MPGKKGYSNVRTKKVRITNEERDFQIHLDQIVREYEARIHDMIEVRDILRKFRKCQYCGGKYYANGLCVNCYNLLRAMNGNMEEFENQRKRYGFRVKKPENWLKDFYKAMLDVTDVKLDQQELLNWYDNFIQYLTEEDKRLIELYYQEGWSVRGSAFKMGKNHGWVVSRVTHLKAMAKKLERTEKNISENT